jgi:hypothetical protein
VCDASHTSIVFPESAGLVITPVSGSNSPR